MATKGNVVRTISRIVPPKEVEDIVQEAYVRICQLDNPDSMEKPSSFLMTMARNLALDHLKRSETRLADSATDESDYWPDNDDQDQVFDTVSSEQEFGQFCEAVRHLPTQCRRVFVLKKVYGYSQKEISKEMNISQSTVEKHIALGLRKCAEYLMELNSGKLGNSEPKKRYSSIENIQGTRK